MIDQFGIAGTPEEVIEKIKTMERKGLTHIMVGDTFGPEPKKAISLFGRGVFPAFGQ